MSKATSTPATRAAVAGLTLVALVTASCAATTNQNGFASETTSIASTLTTTEVQVAESTIPSIEDQPDPPAVEVEQANDETDPSTEVEGLEVLYIGHSFGRPFAENMEAAAVLAGIEGHTQLIVSRGR